MIKRSTRICLGAIVLLLGAQTRIPPRGEALLIWSTWVPDLAHQYTASTLTPTEGHYGDSGGGTNRRAWAKMLC